MKYHDSITKSDEIMSLSVKKLKQWQLPINPINYTIAYHFCKNENSALSEAIKRQWILHQCLDGFFMEERYKEFVLGDSKFRTEIVTDLDNLLSSVHSHCTQSSESALGLIKDIDQSVPKLLSGNPAEVKKATAQLQESTATFKKQQQQLAEQLQASQLITQALKAELQETRKEMHIDPVTGLYNHKAMTEHVNMWLAEDEHKKIAAIVMTVDHFPQFSLQFGSLIGDVILAKIAGKVSSYVNKSGLPVRSNQDEFIILLPDVDGGVASEIAEKIKQGVEKLRFVSVQSGVRLPQITVSFGVSEMKAKEPLPKFVKRIRKTLTLNK